MEKLAKIDTKVVLKLVPESEDSPTWSQVHRVAHSSARSPPIRVAQAIVNPKHIGGIKATNELIELCRKEAHRTLESQDLPRYALGSVT